MRSIQTSISRHSLAGEIFALEGGEGDPNRGWRRTSPYYQKIWVRKIISTDTMCTLHTYSVYIWPQQTPCYQLILLLGTEAGVNKGGGGPKIKAASQAVMRQLTAWLCLVCLPRYRENERLAVQIKPPLFPGFSEIRESVFEDTVNVGSPLGFHKKGFHEIFLSKCSGKFWIFQL